MITCHSYERPQPRPHPDPITSTAHGAGTSAAGAHARVDELSQPVHLGLPKIEVLSVCLSCFTLLCPFTLLHRVLLLLLLPDHPPSSIYYGQLALPVPSHHHKYHTAMIIFTTFSDRPETTAMQTLLFGTTLTAL